MFVVSTDAIFAAGSGASALHAVWLVFKLVPFCSGQGRGHLMSHMPTPESY